MGDTVEPICEVKKDGCTGWDASGCWGEENVFFDLLLHCVDDEIGPIGCDGKYFWKVWATWLVMRYWMVEGMPSG